MVKYVPTYTKGTLSKTSAKDSSNDAYVIFLCCFFLLIFFVAYVVGTHLNCIDFWQVDAIQMGIHNILLYKEEDKKYTGCYLTTTEMLDCALIGVLP